MGLLKHTMVVGILVCFCVCGRSRNGKIRGRRENFLQISEPIHTLNNVI